MSPDADDANLARIRREPPKFRVVEITGLEHLSPWMVRVRFGGPALEGFTVDDPAASVRLLLPTPGTSDLVMPEWNGNEFLRPDGSRPVIRTLTPYRSTVDALELWVVVHDGGPLPSWATGARPGDPVAISGPGRGYRIDRDAPACLVAGDETAIPAISQLLEHLPPHTPTDVHIEVAHPDARMALPGHPRATVTWWDRPPEAAPGAAVVEAVRRAEVAPATRVWAAGEAAAMQRIRRNLFEDRGFTRSDATVRGYWKHGRGGEM